MDKRIQSLLLLQLATLVTNILDIYLLRPFLIFIYISFIPGYLIIRSFKLKFNNKILTTLFSFGLSIFGLIFLGVIVNELYPILGIDRPLSNLSFYTTLNICTLILSLLNINDYSIEKNKLNEKSTKYYLLILPVIGLLGKLYENTLVTVLILVLICIIFITSIFNNENLSETDIIITITSVSITLLLLTSLSSSYFLGGDINREFYVFKLTQMDSDWNPIIDTPDYPLSNYNSMLSITILPTIYSNLMNLEPYLFFKYIFVYFAVFIPIALYKLYEDLFDRKIALIAVFFFISDESMYYGMSAISRNRETIGLIFLILSIYMIINKTINIRQRYMLFIIFGVSLIVTYYAFSYIYIAFLIGVYILSKIFKNKYDYNNIINITSIFILISIKLLYDVFISYTQIRIINAILRDMYYSFYSDIFDPSSRQIENIVGQSYSIFNVFNKLIFYGLNFFILIGVIKLMLDYRKTETNKQYALFSLLGLFTIIALLIIPNLAPTINFARFRIFIMILLSPHIITGCQDFFSYLSFYSLKYNFKIIAKLYSHKKQITFYISILLVLFFVFQIGLVNYVVKDKPVSIILDFERMKNSTNNDIIEFLYSHYIPEQDTFSSRWLYEHSTDNSIIYADLLASYHVLHSSGMISVDRTNVIPEPPFDIPLRNHNYIYFNQMNIIQKLVAIPPHVTTFKYDKMEPIILEYNKIYSNGDNEIYWKK